MPRKSRNRNRNRQPELAAQHVTAPNEPDADQSSSCVETDVENEITEVWTAGDIVKSESADTESTDLGVLAAIESNSRLLQQLVDQMHDLQQVVAIVPSQSEPLDPTSAVPADVQELIRELQHEIVELRARNEELEQQNGDLASQLASESVQRTVAGCGEALSWDQRKEMILQQMEDDSFDAELFLDSLPDQVSSDIMDAEHREGESPAEFVSQLLTELDRRENELSRRDAEIGELRCLLEQQSVARDDGTAVGAAAIATMVDSDELVQEERERLQLLQEEWEEKFRQSEIVASLERAKLSRERQQLAKKTEELEEELEHFRRESRQQEAAGAANSRRWLVKLGLSGDKES